MPTATKQNITFKFPSFSLPKNAGARIMFSQALPLKELKLNFPIALSVEFSGKKTIVYNSDLELWGEGETEGESVHDFANSFEELYFTLKKHRKQLSQNLLPKWQFLNSIISEK